MATFFTYLQIGLVAFVSVLLQDVLETFTDPMLDVACDPKWPTVVEGAQNCLYAQQVVTWFLSIVIVGVFVTALSRGVLLGGSPS
ncbi:hypothetical protein [Halogeometricum limi]|uniref:Uncharacterized protein n=1 Tax=Halogeometricum limi TaxID=555875 RepID=A0A1I6FW39_9EURY|nr:hypothetical protein [Halogeometricum limi]SFR34149.1 hypothetical protein SAMN04488124_0413 [Halogeometricum limi]